MSRTPRTTTRDGRKRQWGADLHQDPMPVVPRIAGEWSMAFGRAAVVVTVVAWVCLVFTVVRDDLAGDGHGTSRLAAALYLVVISLLAASALAYLVGRLGFYYRASKHRRIPRAVIDEFFAERAPGVTALVPSYQEEPGVIKMTLLSAALQEYPDLRVVLLIDDPPNPQYSGPRRLLESARRLPEEVEQILAGPRARFDAALARVTADGEDTVAAAVEDIVELAENYEYAAIWLQELIEGYAPDGHDERFLVNHVLGRLAADLSVVGAALRGALADDPSRLTGDRLLQLYRRLAWTFRAQITSFERKRYASLSAEANKAMNLNSYIGLMGGRYREVVTPAGRVLTDAGDGPADVEVPDTEYILMLDADSVILPEYCLRLVYLLEQSENSRIAVAQCPYSAIPGAATRIERVAGATTDLQHIIHQGMTYYGATFWVGANAVLRTSALDDIEQREQMGPFTIHRYISDRTVIEDTESTIDLAAHGWTLHNYPERLAYSATPPDFGSLCIQRARWANGGLLIVPNLVRAIRRRRARQERTGFIELLLRLNYMASVFWSSLCVLLLMAYRFDAHLFTPLAWVIAVPYFLAMAVDLRYCGYKATDAIRMYGFNLLLLPVNLAGSLSSIVQALTGAKGRFIRTPKVRDRTVPAFVYVALPYVLVAVSAYTLVSAYHHRLWADAAFAALNAVLAAYAIIAFVGIRTSIVDLWVNVVSWLYKPNSYQPSPSRSGPAVASQAGDSLSDWELALYLGFADRRRRPRATADQPADQPDQSPVEPVIRPAVEPVAVISAPVKATAELHNKPPFAGSL